MRRPQRESFVIQIRGEAQVPNARVSSKLNLSAMKLFDRFRKILMCFVVYPFPSQASSRVRRRQRAAAGAGDRFESPKTSFSSYHYSPNSHYHEAIADCIEFFNRSSQEGIAGGRKSDSLV
uniref:Uncharacterized protein n=1 Tax=Nelumbo nucifera TaxID=4432 RepID=A0A822ZCF9_NELNU|nr:TPA_asm: hypothetical protein HUJ06_015492 [Nelumbo nucifera]